MKRKFVQAFARQPVPFVMAVAMPAMMTLMMTLLMACTTTVKPEPPDEPQTLKTFSSDRLYTSSQAPQCKSMLDSYCNYLYSPEVLGNLEIKRADSSTKVLQGETNNEFSQAFFQYSVAKVHNQQLLPRDFYRVLQQYGYFRKLDDFLHRKARKSMSVTQRMTAEKLNFDLGSLWSTGINETVLSRMIKKYPGYHQIPEKLIPMELQIESRQVRRELITELSRAIWRGNKNWTKVEEGFKRLQKSYLHMISRLDIPQSLQKEWTQRISEVRLVLPGSLPAIAGDECSETMVNAYYYSHLNVLTVCAGDFNSEDIIQTLAHEMGHALGIDRAQYMYEQNSKFGKGLSQFRKDICEPKKFSCDTWKQYKDGFEKGLSSLSGFQPELPEFERCLKRRPTSKLLDTFETERISRSLIQDRISDLASSDRFLRITKERVPTKNGKTQKNPNYLNPCSYSLWSEGEEAIDDELTTLMYFTAEYRCSEKKPVEKIKDAIELSKTMSLRVLEKTLQIEGEFSSRSVLEAEGFASPPFERFADVIGSYAMADLLQSVPSKQDRQNLFLASNSWQCLEPSLANHFPEESAVEKTYMFDSHTEGDQRRKELLSEPIRQAISCQKDFDFNECKLPFK